jgi:putative Mn2+ efflux pump MntP
MEALAATVVSKLMPILLIGTLLAAMMILTMGVGWVSGKLIRKFLGIGGK